MKIAVPLALLAAISVSACQDKKEDSPPRPPVSDGSTSTFGNFANRAREMDSRQRPASLGITPEALELNASSPEQRVTLSNAGATPLDLAELKLEGDGDLRMSTDCGTPPRVPAEGNCSVRISWNGSNPSARARLFVTPAGAAGRSVSISASGSVPATPAAPLSPPDAEFLARMRQAQHAQYVAEAAGANLVVTPIRSEFAEPLMQGVGGDPSYAPVSLSVQRDMTRVIDRFRYIAIVLDTDVFVDQPGEVLAHVDQDVPGGINPEHPFRPATVLLPQGTKLRGYYSTENASPERGEFYWTDMRTPKNQAVDLGGTQSYDAAGRAGVPGHIDHRYAERFGPGFVTTLVSAAFALTGTTDTLVVSPLGNTVAQTSPRTRAAEILSKGGEDAGKRIAGDSANFSQRLVIPRGTLITIKLADDLYVPRVGERALPSSADGRSNARPASQPAARQAGRGTTQSRPAPAASTAPRMTQQQFSELQEEMLSRQREATGAQGAGGTAR